VLESLERNVFHYFFPKDLGEHFFFLLGEISVLSEAEKVLGTTN
jgi:hypothetical protein